MTLIPVIDLLNGQVVRGVRGDRQAYRPIESALCGSSDPTTVAGVLCDHCASGRLYVADLDALMGGRPQIAVLERLLGAWPGMGLWLDAGFDDVEAAARVIDRLGPLAARVSLVFGSESLASREALERCLALPVPAVLSLDRRDGERLDAAGCWEAATLWPERVIVMTLERVGSNAGPDLDTIRRLRRENPATRLIGAGGIRSAEDLEAAEAAGADGWLVASALHDLKLPRAARPA